MAGDATRRNCAGGFERHGSGDDPSEYGRVYEAEVKTARNAANGVEKRHGGM